MSKKSEKKSKKQKVKRKESNHSVTISVCLIVKDEERFLENCLKNVKDIADEIIIVDTGSTDNTVAIAKKYTDKVYFHTWENSFCKARNQALQYASGDWIFQIDADEEFMKGSGERVRQAIKNAKNADAIFVKLISLYAHGKQKTAHNYT
ncbi:MAG: glycosyltransferase family 2 protein, partial [Bacteroidales bacterium]|nr:glycosyltransferase family 2 protein [Bacteroidales bacterium]